MFIREGRLIERGVYRIFLELYWAFIGEERLKESGRLLEKIRYGKSNAGEELFSVEFSSSGKSNITEMNVSFLDR